MKIFENLNKNKQNTQNNKNQMQQAQDINLNDIISKILKKKVNIIDIVYDDDGEIDGVLTSTGFIELSDKQLKELEKVINQVNI